MDDILEILTQCHEGILSLCLELQKHSGDDEKLYYEELIDQLESKIDALE